MATINVNFDYFFDRAKVQRHLDRKERGALNKVGGTYRKIVKNSMKSGKPTKRNPGGKSAEPGRPPFYHTKLLKNGILYQYEPNRASVIVGARKLSGSGYRGQIPRLLEHGGQSEGRKMVERTRRGQKQVVPTERIRYRVRPRPFVGERSINWNKALDTLRKVRTELF